jgi:hypothetical protein
MYKIPDATTNLLIRQYVEKVTPLPIAGATPDDVQARVHDSHAAPMVLSVAAVNTCPEVVPAVHCVAIMFLLYQPRQLVSKIPKLVLLSVKNW